MIKDVFVVDAAAHSYNLGEDNYAVGRYSQAVVDAFYGAHYNLSPVGYRLPREHFTRDWTVAETAKMLYVESDEFAVERANGKAKPFATTSSKGFTQ
jgi:hypothetical protein